MQDNKFTGQNIKTQKKRSNMKKMKVEGQNWTFPRHLKMSENVYFFEMSILVLIKTKN
jgi:hypothetical protein